MRPGVRLGVDVGEVRVGLARCDPHGLLATPVATLTRDVERQTDLAEIAERAREAGAIEVVVGLPRALSGQEGRAAAQARRYAEALSRYLPGVSVRLWDERLSTVDAHRELRMSGVPTRHHRSRVDQAAAVLILQSALDAERALGSPGGEVVAVRKPRHRANRDRHQGRQP